VPTKKRLSNWRSRGGNLKPAKPSPICPGRGRELCDTIDGKFAKSGTIEQRYSRIGILSLRQVFANLSPECWSTVAQLIERRVVILPNDEKLIA